MNIPPLGKMVRAVLGRSASRWVGGLYRSVFVDLHAVAQIVAREIPTGAHVLDVGGGDGALIDLLLDIRPDITVTALDVAPTVGQWIRERHIHRVRRLPSTSLDDYLASGGRVAQAILLADVIHHVPIDGRANLLRTITSTLATSPSTRLIVKDVEPGHWRSRLGLLSDRYVTGDRNVRLVSSCDLVAAMRRVEAAIQVSETELFARDSPNYAMVFWR